MITPTQLRTTLVAAHTYRLHDTTLSLLALLHERESVIMSTAAEYLHVSIAGITQIADRLESLKFASRTYQRADRRKISLQITPRGTAAITAILAGNPYIAPPAPSLSLVH